MEAGHSKLRLVADELMHYLLYKYSRGEVSVRTAEITDFIYEKHKDKFTSKKELQAYVSRAVNRLSKYNAVVVTKEIGERGYRLSLTLTYLGTVMYNPRQAGVVK